MKKPKKKIKKSAPRKKQTRGYDISPLTERGADYGYMLIPLGRKAPKVAVQGGDYKYSGRVRGLAIKSTGALRYVVEDRNRRLFIHNAGQLNKPEGWLP
jgi:hypothetical protein